LQFRHSPFSGIRIVISDSEVAVRNVPHSQHAVIDLLDMCDENGSAKYANKANDGKGKLHGMKLQQQTMRENVQGVKLQGATLSDGSAKHDNAGRDNVGQKNLLPRTDRATRCQSKSCQL